MASVADDWVGVVLNKGKTILTIIQTQLKLILWNGQKQLWFSDFMYRRTYGLTQQGFELRVCRQSSLWTWLHPFWAAAPKMERPVKHGENLSIHPSIHLSICLSVYLFLCPSIYVSIYLLINQPVRLPTCPTHPGLRLLGGLFIFSFFNQFLMIFNGNVAFFSKSASGQPSQACI